MRATLLSFCLFDFVAAKTVFNYFDIVFIACFLALIAMHFVQMVMEMSIDLDVVDDVFVATTFRVAQVHTAQKFLFGWACFFAWFKMFEYLRLTQSFAVMFFIIIGMIEKLMSFLVILLVGLLAFTSVDFLVLGSSRARSMTFLDSLISRFSGSLGDGALAKRGKQEMRRRGRDRTSRHSGADVSFYWPISTGEGGPYYGVDSA